MTSSTAEPAPRLGAGVEILPPPAVGQSHVVRSGERYLRIGADAARVLAALDGRATPGDLAIRLGRPWSEDVVRTALAGFNPLGLLGDGAAPGPPRRLRMATPWSIQFTLADPDRWFARARPALRRLDGRWAALLTALIGVLGVVALCAQRAAVQRVLGTPVAPRTLGAVWAGLIVTMALHELAHAATLVHYGGR